MSENAVQKSRFVIYITGEIGGQTYEGVVDAVNQYLANVSEYDGITLFINSPGGKLSGGLAIYDLIKSLNTSVYTVAIGECSSIATAIYSLGEKRFASDNISFTVHSASIIPGDCMNQLYTDQLYKRIKIQNRRFANILKGIPNVSKEFKDLIDNIFTNCLEEMLTSKEMLKYNVATHKYKSLYDIV